MLICAWLLLIVTLTLDVQWCAHLWLNTVFFFIVKLIWVCWVFGLGFRVCFLLYFGCLPSLVIGKYCKRQTCSLVQLPFWVSQIEWQVQSLSREKTGFITFYSDTFYSMMYSDCPISTSWLVIVCHCNTYMTLSVIGVELMLWLLWEPKIKWCLSSPEAALFKICFEPSAPGDVSPHMQVRLLMWVWMWVHWVWPLIRVRPPTSDSQRLSEASGLLSSRGHSEQMDTVLLSAGG